MVVSLLLDGIRSSLELVLQSGLLATSALWGSVWGRENMTLCLTALLPEQAGADGTVWNDQQQSLQP